MAAVYGTAAIIFSRKMPANDVMAGNGVAMAHPS
jgi:hypothetical protein